MSGEPRAAKADGVALPALGDSLWGCSVLWLSIVGDTTGRPAAERLGLG